MKYGSNPARIKSRIEYYYLVFQLNQDHFFVMLARSLDLGTLVYQRWLTKVEPWFTNVG